MISSTNQRGFSLIEVMIALAVISVAVVGLVKMQVYMEVKANNALKTLEALHIAEIQMEYYQTRASEISGATQLIDFAVMDNDSYCLTDLVSDNDFTLACDVSPPIMSGALRTMEVTVSWQDRRDTLQKVSLQTSASKYSEFD